VAPGGRVQRPPPGGETHKEKDQCRDLAGAPGWPSRIHVKGIGRLVEVAETGLNKEARCG